MPTYFVNTAGSDTFPYDTEGKGATTFKNLFDNITQANGDIIEVIDGAEIDDSGALIPDITKEIIIRSYSGNTEKPIIKIYNTNYGFKLQGASGSPKIQQLKIYKAGPSAGSNFIKIDSGSYISPEITENEMWIANTTGMTSPVGVFIEVSTTTFSGQLKIEKNEIYDMLIGIQTNNGGGG